jgi:hypothetical protein
VWTTGGLGTLQSPISENEEVTEQKKKKRASDFDASRKHSRFAKTKNALQKHLCSQSHYILFTKPKGALGLRLAFI